MLYKKLLNRHLLVIFQSIVLGLLFINIIATLLGHYTLIVVPQDLDYAERWLAYVAFQAFPGGDHVASAYGMPYNTLPYPPVGFLMNGWVGRILGADLLGVRTVGRVVSLTAMLLSAGLIALIAFSIRGRFVWGIVAGLLFLTAKEAHFFAVSLRPDELACMVTLLGIYTIISTGSYLLAGSIFAMALATKHSFISIPTVIVVSLLLKRDWRKLGKFIAAGCLTGLLIFMVSTWVLGPYWWQGSLLQGFSFHDTGLPALKQMIFLAGKGLQQPVLAFGLASLMLINSSGSLAIISAGFAVSLLLNLVMLVKVGAAENYFLEPVALASILVACAAQQFLGKQAIRSRAAVWALVIALIVPLTVEQGIYVTHLINGKNARNSESKALFEIVSKVQGPILTDNSGIYFDSHHPPFVSPPDLIMAATEAGKIDDLQIQVFIQQKGFDMIVVRQNWKEFRRFPKAWIEIIEANYQNSDVVDGFQIFKPKL